MIKYTPYTYTASTERSQLLLGSRGASMIEDMRARQLEKTSRRSRLDYKQEETYLTPTRHIGRREAIIAMGKKEAALTTKAEAEKARRAGYIVSKEGKIRKRGYWEKQRRVFYRSAVGFKDELGAVGAFSPEEMEQWGGPGSSWGQSSWDSAEARSLNWGGASNTRTYTMFHSTSGMGQDNRSTPTSLAQTFGAITKDYKAEIASRALTPLIRPIKRGVIQPLARAVGGSIVGRAAGSVSRSGLGRGIGSVTSNKYARTGFGIALSAAGKADPRIGLGISAARAIGSAYRRA